MGTPQASKSTTTLPLQNQTSSHESSSPMSIENLKSFDPFAEAEDNQPDTKKGAQDYIHIRIQQRNGRKTLTTVQGLQGDHQGPRFLSAVTWSLVRGRAKAGGVNDTRRSFSAPSIRTLHLALAFAHKTLSTRR